MSSPTVTTLPMVDLHIDATYHTTLNGEAFESLCQAFNPAALGWILVNRRADGTSWVIDGATRVLALRSWGVKHVVAEVVEGWTLEQERAAYRSRNPTFPQYPMDLYTARLVAEGLMTLPS
jgi:hypothetical protein